MTPEPGPAPPDPGEHRAAKVTRQVATSILAGTIVIWVLGVGWGIAPRLLRFEHELLHMLAPPHGHGLKDTPPKVILPAIQAKGMIGSLMPHIEVTTSRDSVVVFASSRSAGVELNANVEGRTLVVRGLWSEGIDGAASPELTLWGQREATFVQRLVLPADADLEAITRADSDGALKVVVPRRAA